MNLGRTDVDERISRDSRPAQTGDLRREAEQCLRDRNAVPIDNMAGVDVRALFHELQVNQIELEMRNKELQRSEQQLAGILGSAMDAIISVDAAHRIVLFNAAAETMFCCPAAEAIGQPLERFIPERFRSAHAEHMRAFAETGMTGRTAGRLTALVRCGPMAKSSLWRRRSRRAASAANKSSP